MLRPLEAQEGVGHFESELRTIRTFGILAIGVGVTSIVRAANRLRQQYIPPHDQANGWRELDLAAQPEQLPEDPAAA